MRESPMRDALPPAVGADLTGRDWLVTRLRRHLSELLRLAGPVIIARAGVLTMAMVDTIMVGRFSAEELAYQSLGLAPVQMAYLIGLGLLVGTVVVTAQANGRDDWSACGAAWRRAVPYAFGLGLVVAVICLFGETLLRLARQPEDLAVGGGAVMRVIGYGIPFALVYIASAFFLEGLKRPMVGMLLMLIANLINVALNWVLVYGQFGLPALGAVGSAWATTAVRILLAMAMVGYIWFLMADRDRFGVRRPTGGGWRAWAEQRRLGYAAGLSIGLEVGAFTVMTMFAGWLGVVSLAAYSITINLLALIFMVALGLGSATAVRVGTAHARHDAPDMALAGWTGLAVTGLAMVLCGGGLWLFATPIAGIYTTDPAVVALAAPLIAYLVWVAAADGGQGVMAHALRGRGETWIPTLCHFVSYILVMIPACWLLAFPLGRGAAGLLEGVLIASLVSVGLLCWRFQVLAVRDRSAAGSSAGGGAPGQ